MYFNDRKTCECGMSIVSRTTFGFLESLDKHKETQKHNDLMELKARDIDSWKLAIETKTEKVKCPCGTLQCRWSLLRHQETPTHKRLMAQKKAPKP